MGITKKEKKNYIKKEIIKEARPCDVCFEKTSAERKRKLLAIWGYFLPKGFFFGHCFNFGEGD